VTRFADLADAGRAVARLVQPETGAWPDPVLVPVLPNGVPVVLGMVETLALPVVPLRAHRSDDGVVIDAPEGMAGRTAIVVDDGVETGTVARAAAPILREAGVARLVLAVPVCSREASAHLDLVYDEVIAAVRPLGRRSLAWHFEDFDTVDDAQAVAMLARASLGGTASS
jgi:predicted phosphoribosyltransferase